MTETKMLCLCEGRNDPKDLEEVLYVLDHRLLDGDDGRYKKRNLGTYLPQNGRFVIKRLVQST